MVRVVALGGMLGLVQLCVRARIVVVVYDPARTAVRIVVGAVRSGVCVLCLWLSRGFLCAHCGVDELLCYFFAYAATRATPYYLTSNGNLRMNLRSNNIT